MGLDVSDGLRGPRMCNSSLCLALRSLNTYPLFGAHQGMARAAGVIRSGASPAPPMWKVKH